MTKSKVTIVLTLIALILSGGALGYKIHYETTKPVADITRNINVLLEKSKDWRKIVKNSPFTKDTYPKIDGSTATIPMSMEFAREHFDMSEDEVRKFVNHNTTHEAYVNLIDGKADIIFVSEPSKDELNLSKEKGVELELTPVARDAFVFIVNKSNPVNNLKLSQIQQIYQGKITNWKDVGGKDKEIVAYQREKNSGSQTIMENKVMRGLDMMKPPSFKTEVGMVGMGGLVDQVAEFKDAESSLGYTIYYYVTRLYKKENVKLLGINGIDCSQKTIKDGSYPLSGNVYAVILKSKPEDSSARKLLSWILSDEGQECIKQAGYVGIK